MVAVNKKYNRGTVRRNDIITGIIESDLNQVLNALGEDPACVNQLHRESGMNASMLSAQSVMPDFLNEILKYANYQDFSTRDALGRDLLEVSLSSNDPEIIEAVTGAYERYARHIINNWPEP